MSAPKLHRWITVALLSGENGPTDLDDRIAEEDEPTRRAFLQRGLRLGTDGSRIVLDVRGYPIEINDRIVSKTIRDPRCLTRTPYIPNGAPFALQRAVEIWHHQVVSASGELEDRTYYLAPFNGHKSYDGYVAIVHAGIMFNLIPADASYLETQRQGDLVWQKDRFGACEGPCCVRILAERAELKRLRVQTLNLQKRAASEKARRLIAERQLKRPNT
jgi:hypothetical protein